MPGTRYSVFNPQGESYVPETEQFAERQRASRMSDWIAQQALRQQLEMQGAGFRHDDAKTQYLGGLQKELEGTYGQRSADETSRLKLGYGHENELADKKYAYGLADRGLVNQGNLDVTRAGNEPEMYKIDFENRKYDDLSPGVRAKSNAEAERYNLMNSFLKDFMGQGGGAPAAPQPTMRGAGYSEPAGPAFGDPAAAPAHGGMPLGGNKRTGLKILGGMLGIQGLDAEDPIDVGVRGVVAELMKGADPADYPKFVEAMRTGDLKGLPGPRSVDPDALQVSGEAQLAGLGTSVPDFVKRDTSLGSWDPEEADIQAIVEQRDQMAQGLMKRYRLPRERAMQMATSHVTRQLAGPDKDLNAGWIRTLQQALGARPGTGPAQAAPQLDMTAYMGP